MRTIRAFLFAPLVVPPLLAALLLATGIDVPFPGFLVAAGVVAYLCTIVLGVPAVLMFQAWRLNSWQAYLVGGAFLALLPAVGAWFAFPSLAFPAAVVLAGAAEALVFWTLRKEKSNMSVEPTA